jgi:hypothetical protein
MCGVCNGRKVVKDEVIKGAYLIKHCPVCRPKNIEELDKEMAAFNKRLREAIANHEKESSTISVHSA